MAAARSGAYRQVVAGLLGRVVIVPDDEELVARGAALQAATMLCAADVQSIADSWHLGRGKHIAVDPAVDAAAIMDRFVRTAERERPQ